MWQTATLCNWLSVASAQAVLAKSYTLNSPIRSFASRANMANSYPVQLAPCRECPAVLAKSCILNFHHSRSNAANSYSFNWLSVGNAQAMWAKACTLNLLIRSFASAANAATAAHPTEAASQTPRPVREFLHIELAHPQLRCHSQRGNGCSSN